jgi:hypothetical protein
LKGDAFLAEQRAQALVADVVDHPLGDQEVGELGQAPGREGQAVLSGVDLAVFLISLRCGKVNFGGWPPLYFGYSEVNPSALKLRITSRTRSSLVKATFAITGTSMP